ncbi:MAG: SUMF1/EgtB/PvdO family nonheme iron enzyme [Deltaproteobacteria bacterium]|nr:SUMF1/EgtB/PvdO family nonheme iron enzyme [Deltaproteobacteria bacterium]
MAWKLRWLLCCGCVASLASFGCQAIVGIEDISESPPVNGADSAPDVAPDSSPDANPDVSPETQPETSPDTTQPDGDASQDVTQDGDAPNPLDAPDGAEGDAGEPGVATVGQPCTKPSALACAGHAQKLVLFCDPSTNKWTALQSCSGQQLCDTQDGVTQGSCQDPVALCIGHQPADKVCDGKKLVVCGPDLVTSTSTDCPNVCAAGACSGSCTPQEKDCQGQVPRTCDAQGAWQPETACPYGCDQGACTGECVPASKQCNGKIPQLCDDKGAWQDGTACGFACVAGDCSGSCAPGEKTCNALVPQQCDQTGTWQDGAACPFVCTAGACTGECHPDDKQCAAGNTPQLCDANGTWQSGAACTAVCSAGDCVGSCTPADKQCSGKIPQTCNSGGAWIDGTACAHVCKSGDCIGVCDPNAKQCSNKIPQTCDADGAWQSGTACPFVCSAGTCSGECNPGAVECGSGGIPKLCNAQGLWESSTQCQYVCIAGVCTGECSPGAKQCSGKTPQTCDGQGQWQNGTACQYVCTAGSCGGVCNPTDVQCAGNVPQLCDSSGQWQSQAACSYVCAAGQCSGVCVPGSKQCSGNIPQLCDSSGQWANQAACPFVCSAGACTGGCTPGTHQCNGSVPQTCDAGGQWVDGTACTGGTPICNAGACQPCPSGYANCDGSSANGCEVNLNADPTHCGSCTKVCSTVHATATCTGGNCAIVCASGWGNCDGNIDTGCEVDLNTSTGNCGSCAKACGSANGTPSCASGVCAIACGSGWGNCDGVTDNGCEVDLNSSLGNCGACGVVCSPINGQPSCTSGTCAIQCNTDFGNCDNNAANGCEVAFKTDMNNCGQCGHVCSTAHGTGACQGGICVMLSCATGYDDCNNTGDDGCEVNLNTDEGNCGTCGHVCNSYKGTPVCNSGWCGIDCGIGRWNCDGDPDNGCEATLACGFGPSCNQLATDCGRSGMESCCANRGITGTTFNRSNDSSYPATVSSFNIDKYEVTVGRFRKFVAGYPTNKPKNGEGKNPSSVGDPGWQALAYDPELPSTQAALTTAIKCGTQPTWTDAPGQNENRPMNCVTWFEAYAFCIWDGGRLANEAEWNLVAAGGPAPAGQRYYPWSFPSSSTAIDPENASYSTSSGQCNGDGLPGCTVADLIRVGWRPLGYTRYGQAEMAGNVAEWVVDWYAAYMNPCTNCAAYSGGTNRVVRGGSLFGLAADLDTLKRGHVLPTARSAGFGIRCVRN